MLTCKVRGFLKIDKNASMHVRNTVNVKVNLLLRLLKLYVHYDTNVRLIYRFELIG